MKIYNFDKKTKIYTGFSQADADPMRPDSWLMPAQSTQQPPCVCAQGEVAVFDGNAWQARPDVRGQWYSGVGQSVQVTELDHDVSALSRNAQPSDCHILQFGVWVLDDILVDEKFFKLKKDRIDQFRETREIALNRLVGTAFFAQLEGDSKLLSACQMARQALLDLPNHQTVASSAKQDDLTKAIADQQGEISKMLPPFRQAIFSGLRF